MKKIIAYSFNLLFLVTFLASCLGDLDTMPLDNNQLVSDQVYKTKDGYTGVLAKCYSSLILTGQQGGDGGNGDLEDIRWLFQSPFKKPPIALYFTHLQ